VVMEPIRGGSLAGDPPEAVKQLWASARMKRTPADWALQWVWNQPEVSIVLSGMSNMQQVVENVASADRSDPGSLGAEDLELIARVGDQYKALRPVQCTSCGYCMPCPQGVDIPQNFFLYNGAAMFNLFHRYRRNYGRMDASRRAGSCIECGVCEEKCPQNLKIRDLLKEVDKSLGVG